MQVVLISPYGDLGAVGVRFLSASLKRAGHQVRIVFLPFSRAEASYSGLRPTDLYGERVLTQVAELCRDAGLVGISLMTSHFHRARRITEYLRPRIAAPIVWGGVHVTVQPEQCIEHVDLICVGEGDEVIVELADRIAAGRNYDEIGNLWCKSPDGRIRRNAPRPLIRDLDSLPVPDHDPSDHLVLDQGRIKPVTPGLFATYMQCYAMMERLTFPMLTTRGCPHRCSYCSNSAYAALYHDWSKVRRRSIDHVIAEIREIRNRYPEASAVGFYDDEFMTVPVDYLADFAKRYRAEVNLPFYCLAGPTTITPEKLEILLAAGMTKVAMGIESGSQLGQKVFNRPAKTEKILQATRTLHKHMRVSPAYRPIIYDLITDSPYEGVAEQLETLELLRKIAPPFELFVFSLKVFPGTALYERAAAAGRVARDSDLHDRTFFDLKPTYYNLVLHAVRQYGIVAGNGYRQSANDEPDRSPRDTAISRVVEAMAHPAVFRLLSSSLLRPLWRSVYPRAKARIEAITS